MARRRSSSWGWDWGYSSRPTMGDIARTSKKSLSEAKKKGRDYHPVVITGRKIAKTWWGQSWCSNLERYADYSNRLPRGRSYVLHGAVVDLVLEPGHALAKVQGSSLYKVEICFDPLDSKKEKELSSACSAQIQNIEELLSGSFPERLKEQFFARDALFPAPRQIHFSCSCPDWASMCKHVAAVMYGIGARLDEEPIRFFDLRGIQVDDFIARAVESKVESMLKNAACKSSRILSYDHLEGLFGLDIEAPSVLTRPEVPDCTEMPETSASVRESILGSGCTDKIKRNLLHLYDSLHGAPFTSAQIIKVLNCSPPTAANYIKRLQNDLGLIEPAQEMGKGSYRFRT